jgi:hypothetical protein
MRAWPAVLMGSLLLGQDAMPVVHPSPAPSAVRLKLRKSYRTPLEMIQAMVAQEAVQRRQPGTTVEVIGYDDEAILNLLSQNVAQKVRLEFRNTDKMQHQELYEFMRQDPSHPGPVLILPALAGGPVARAADKWLK